MMKKILYLILGLIGVLSVKAQPDCFFTHYSSEDGLSQNTVMSILQDRKGNIWLATWDGINKFNGYSFKTYKARLDNRIVLSHNRIDHMLEDKYGFLWLQTYDNHAYRFDPRTETFERAPGDDEEGGTANITNIKVLPGGSVWLLTETEGVIRVATDPQDYSLTSQYYSTQSGQFSASRVFQVYEDRAGNEWILSDNGLGMLAPGEKSPVFYFAETAEREKKGGQAFYSCLEHGPEIYFGSDNGRVWRYQKESGQFLLLSLPVSSHIVSINHIDGNEIILTTSKDGFFTYKCDTKKTEHFPASRFPDAPIHGTYVDKASEVWFEQHIPGTVVHFNPRTQVLKREVIAVEPTSTDRSRPAFHAHEDINGMLWVHPYGGGFSYFDRESNSLRPFYNELSGHDWRFSNKIHTAFSDNQGNLWMCTHSKGLEKVTFRPSQFGIVTPVPHDYESLSNEVRALCEDADQNLWVGLKDGKLRIYDKNRVNKGYLTENGTVSHSGTPLRGNVYFILQDSKQNFWIATKGDGLVKAEKQKDSYHYKLTRYQHQEGDIYSLSDDNVYCVYEDKHGRIWIATFAGGINYMAHSQGGKEIFVNHRNNLKGYPIDYCYKARFITGDDQGHIWIGTTVGALMMDADFKNPEDVKFRHFLRVPDNEHSLSNNDVHWIVSTRNKELFIATFGGGLNKLVSLDESGNACFKSYTVQDGLPSDVLLSIQEDKAGNLWLSSENGISKFIPSKEKFENYADKEIFFRVRFSEAASEYTASGNILFGASTGIFYFNPDSIGKSNYVPPMVFSKLLVANVDVVPGQGSVLKQGLDDTKELVLSHRENIFTIQFAALDYSAPSEIQYAYILEGFEKAWNYVGKQRVATYTNLPKGHYVFKVRSTNSDGIWTENTRTLDIEILPSFWETPFAYFLYVLFFIMIIVAAVYILFTIYRLKHEVSVEQQMTDMKLRFFTDISHELRTPLTLIKAPLGEILKNEQLSEQGKININLAIQNTDNLSELASNLINFEKEELYTTTVYVSRYELNSYIKNYLEQFNLYARKKQITIQFETNFETQEVWLDRNKMDSIIRNLMSNALKYTRQGGSVTVQTYKNKTHWFLTITDTGIGIPANEQKKMFRSLFRGNNAINLQITGSGIGMLLTYKLIKSHAGKISMNSTENVGTTFKLAFPIKSRRYNYRIFKKTDVVDPLPVVGETPEVTVEAAQATPQNAQAPSILIVEDNVELRTFLMQTLSEDYKVSEVGNGQEALDFVKEQQPDLILSDIMMPIMNGDKMCNLLKSDIETSHIPIILLTALNDKDSIIKGLQTKADKYIIKPFDVDVLKANIANVLANKEIIKKRFSQFNFSTDEIPDEPGLDLDQEFIVKVTDTIKQNINKELNVEILCGALNMSRSSFYNKIKALTNYSPSDFIRKVRMNEASILLKSKRYTVSEVSDLLGFSDPKYFTDTFKKYYGVPPSTYMKQN